MTFAVPRRHTWVVPELDPQTTIAIIVAVSLMVTSGIAKKQLRPRGPRVCPVCGLRHASARCLRL